MSDETFDRWMKYQFVICERQDSIGASHHTPDILRKEKQYQIPQPSQALALPA